VGKPKMYQKKEFEEYLKSIGKSKNTINQYSNIVNRLTLPLTEKNLSEFVRDIPVSETRATYISAIKSFLLFSKNYVLFEKFVGGKIK